MSISSEEPEAGPPVDRRETYGAEFQLKTTLSCRTLVVAALPIAASRPAFAQPSGQSLNGRWQLSPQTSRGGSTSRGIEAPPPPPRTVVERPSPMGTIHWSEPVAVPRQPVAFT